MGFLLAIARGESEWERVAQRFTARLDMAALGVRLRAVNSAGVSGPERLLALERK